MKMKHLKILGLTLITAILFGSSLNGDTPNSTYCIPANSKSVTFYNTKEASLAVKITFYGYEIDPASKKLTPKEIKSDYVMPGESTTLTVMATFDSLHIKFNTYFCLGNQSFPDCDKGREFEYDMQINDEPNTCSRIIWNDSRGAGITFIHTQSTDHSLLITSDVTEECESSSAASSKPLPFWWPKW